MKPVDIRAVLAGLVMLLVVLFTVPLSAHQLECGPHARFAGRITDATGRWRETRVAMGLANTKRVLVEIYINRKTGTWTVLGTTPTGTSCILAAGTDWMKSPSRAGKPQVHDGPGT